MDIDIDGEIFSSEDDAVVPSDFQLRKEYQKTRDFTVVKCGFLKLCDNHRMRDLLEVCVQRCSIISEHPRITGARSETSNESVG